MYKVKGSIWVEHNDVAFIGSGRIVLLEMIKKYGSITLAAKSIKMSYRQAGGVGGGGTKVTKEGEALIASFRDLQKRFHQFNEQESKNLKF